MMIKHRLLRIEPLGASFTGGLLAVVIAAASFTLLGLEQYFKGQGTELLLSMPLKTLYYGLLISTSVFALTIAFNIAVRYTGGIELTLRDARAKSDESPASIGPPPVAS
jgi:hypothetical protein